MSIKTTLIKRHFINNLHMAHKISSEIPDPIEVCIPIFKPIFRVLAFGPLLQFLLVSSNARW